MLEQIFGDKIATGGPHKNPLQHEIPEEGAPHRSPTKSRYPVVFGKKKPPKNDPDIIEDGAENLPAKDVARGEGAHHQATEKEAELGWQENTGKTHGIFYFVRDVRKAGVCDQHKRRGENLAQHNKRPDKNRHHKQDNTEDAPGLTLPAGMDVLAEDRDKGA